MPSPVPYAVKRWGRWSTADQVCILVGEGGPSSFSVDSHISPKTLTLYMRVAFFGILVYP